MTLTLHYAPDNASLCIRLALESTSTPYQTRLVDRAVQGQKAPQYLALNPNGLIPVLETPDGVMFETGAILLWLADRHPALLPQSGPARASALKWLIWIAATLHPAQRMQFYPDQYHKTEPAELQRTAQNRVAMLLDILERSSDSDWLKDETCAPSCYLAPMLRWCGLYGGDTAWFDLAKWPRLNEFARRMEQHPSHRHTTELEGLGATPFSAPSPPNPPEGSAI